MTNATLQQKIQELELELGEAEQKIIDQDQEIEDLRNFKIKEEQQEYIDSLIGESDSLRQENESLRQELTAARIQKKELKQQPVALASESQPQTFKPGWVRVTQKEAAEIATRERHCPLDPQPPVTVNRLSKMSATTLEKYGLRRVRGSYEFYQKVDSGSGFLPIIPEEAIQEISLDL